VELILVIPMCRSS